jgi:hypothetical protein
MMIDRGLIQGDAPMESGESGKTFKIKRDKNKKKNKAQ